MTGHNPYTAPQTAAKSVLPRVQRFRLLLGISAVVVIFTRFMPLIGSPFAFVWLGLVLTPAISSAWRMRSFPVQQKPQVHFSGLVVRSLGRAWPAVLVSLITFFIVGLCMPAGYFGMNSLVLLLLRSQPSWVKSTIGILGMLPLFIGTFLALWAGDVWLRRKDRADHQIEVQQGVE